MKQSPLSANKKFKNLLSEIAVLVAGSVLFAVAMNMFLLPAEVVIGGVTGISTVLNILFNTPVGIMIMLINIPLVVINGIKFGFKFVVKTIIGLAASSVATDILPFLPVITEEKLLCAIFGGLTMGAGLGLFFSKGFTTGGTDLISCLLKLKFPKLSNAKLIFAVDMIVVVVSSIVLKDFSDIFYSVIAILVGSIFIDVVLGGLNRAKLALIVSDNPDEVSAAIMKRINRGTTLLSGKGGFTMKDKQVVMCVVKKDQIYDLKVTINEVSPEAFIIFADASEVRGIGFESDAL